MQQLIEEEAALAEAGGRASPPATPKCERASSRIRRSRRTDGSSATRGTGNSSGRRTAADQPNDFEEDVRRSILAEKLQGALTDWMTVADTDVDTEFNRRNEKVKLA